ncbi:MAG: YicC family protein [Gammaproteobacteria bacterium]|nr:YicC family protein [Gammaproteobacteria bacterium]
MIHSMTGFASSESDTPQGTLLWELRSVNHRYLEMQFKLPDGFRALEPALRELISRKLKRGKVDATLHFRPATTAAANLTVNEELAQQVIQQAEKLAAAISTPQSFSSLDVLRWPGVVAEDGVDLKALFDPAQALLSETLDALVANRAREGERIQAALDERLVQIDALGSSVAARMPLVLDGIRARVRERALGLEIKVDDERLEQELVLLAQKMDVAEELDRLHAHVAETRETFAMDGAVGRRLDFLMQEFNREANTLGSKSADPETTRAAVDLKVLIEQLREQVQNVE